MQALILNPHTKSASLQTVPIPTPKLNELLIKVDSISLNPIDPLYVFHPLATTPRIIGSDFAGTIISFGAAVPSSANLSPGVRVAGFLQGACSVNERPGAFSGFVIAEWDLVWQIPGDMNIEEACGVSLVALTAAQGVWFRLGLPAPFKWDEGSVVEEHPEWTWWRDGEEKMPEGEELRVFVYGASTAVGLLFVQMARISARKIGKNLKAFGVASRRNWDLLAKEPYGYDGLVDYHDEDWPEQVRGMVGEEGVHFAYDAVSENESVAKVSGLLAPNGRMAIVRSKPAGAWNPENVRGEPVYGAVWEGLGAEIQYSGFTVPRSEAARGFAVEFFRWLSGSVGREIRPVPVRVMPGGLERVVQDGFELLGSGKVAERRKETGENVQAWMRPVSAEKLVYGIRE